MEPESSAKHEIRFTGNGETYFGIWIVNLLLTIVTIGLYSPWAKVRRLKYLYGNTLLDDSPFDYHGSPIALFKGRLIGLLLLLAYSQTAKISFGLWLAVVGVIAVALPWLLWKSQQFRLRNSSYRGVRFGFDGTLGQSYWTFGLPMLIFIAPYVLMGYLGFTGKFAGTPSPRIFLPIGLLFLLIMALSPWLYLRVKRYQHGNARLGSTRFTFSATVMGVYGLGFAALGLGILALVLAALFGVGIGFVANLIAQSFTASGGDPQAASTGAPAHQVIGMVVGGVAGYATVFCVYPLVTAMRQNFIWGNTGLGGATFQSRARGLKLLEIYVVNAFLVIVTLGLYWPYALVRTLRYQLEAISWTGDPGAVLAHAADSGVSAVGEETAEIFGFDLAL